MKVNEAKVRIHVEEKESGANTPYAFTSAECLDRINIKYATIVAETVWFLKGGWESFTDGGSKLLATNQMKAFRPCLQSW